jgi:DNA-binding PadR family transcriptional regulator
LISAPKGVLRLAALKLLSESSMSGADLTEEIARVTAGEWRPGPGSIYLMLGELLKKGLITELTKREGNERRYIISGKGKAELERLSQETEGEVARQLRLLAVYSSLAGDPGLEERLSSAARSIGGSPRGPVRQAQ